MHQTKPYRKGNGKRRRDTARFPFGTLASTLGCLLGIQAAWAGPETLSLEEMLNRLETTNPEIAAMKARVHAEHHLARSQAAPANPKIGWMRENNLTSDQMENGPMNFWSISQEIMFPAKYFAMGSAQSARAQTQERELQNTKLEIRRQAVTAYFNIHAWTRTLRLLEAQRETLREIARIAEARRATGAVPQQDEMKAHVEQTRLETDILMARQELDEAEARLNALLGQDAEAAIKLDSDGLETPKLKAEIEKATELALSRSREIAAGHSMVEEAEAMRRLARLGYAPDFMISYRKPFTNAMAGAYGLSVELSVPLWFFLRQAPEISAAGARVAQAERDLEKVRRNTHSEARALATKARTSESLLKIYETSLIPQATSTLNSSRAAYAAGRIGFMEFLDSERSLYEVRIAYFRTLSQFIENLTLLEKVTGASVSTLPFPALSQGESP